MHLIFPYFYLLSSLPLLTPPVDPNAHPGVCPSVDAEEMAFGTCPDMCDSDGACDGTEKCCPTPCGGSACVPALQIQPGEFM